MSDTPVAMASRRIFCMYLTTGASSTSVIAAVFIGLALAARFQKFHFEIVGADQVLHGLAERLDDLGDGDAELVVLDDDGIDHQVGLEPDLVQRLHIRRVGHRDEKPVAALMQRQDASRHRYSGVDKVLVDLIEIETGEIEQRRAECARCKDGDLRRIHPLGKQHLLDETDARRLRLSLKRLSVVFGQ